MIIDNFAVSVHDHGGSRHVSIAGDIDLLTAERFRAALAEAVQSTPRRVELDLRDVEYIGAQGAQLLDDAADAAEQIDVEFRIVQASEVVRRVLESVKMSHRLF